MRLYRKYFRNIQELSKFCRFWGRSGRSRMGSRVSSRIQATEMTDADLRPLRSEVRHALAHPAEGNCIGNVSGPELFMHSSVGWRTGKGAARAVAFEGAERSCLMQGAASLGQLAARSPGPWSTVDVGKGMFLGPRREVNHAVVSGVFPKCCGADRVALRWSGRGGVPLASADEGGIRNRTPAECFPTHLPGL